MMRSTLVLLAVALVGCTSASEPLTVEPAAVSSVVPAATRPEAEASTTRAAREVGALDAVAPAAEPDNEADVEAVVLALHARVMGELFARDERIDGPEAQLALAKELSTGPLLSRIRNGAEQRSLSGERVASPGYGSNVLEVSVQVASATVVDCSQDRSVLLGSDGAVLIDADDFWKVRRVEYVLTADGWRANELISGGDERCEPSPS